MGSEFTVTYVNICVKWLFMVSYLPSTQRKKERGSKQ